MSGLVLSNNLTWEELSFDLRCWINKFLFGSVCVCVCVCVYSVYKSDNIKTWQEQRSMLLKPQGE